MIPVVKVYQCRKDGRYKRGNAHVDMSFLEAVTAEGVVVPSQDKVDSKEPVRENIDSWHYDLDHQDLQSLLKMHYEGILDCLEV